MRILYYTWNENSQRDMAESLVKLGYNVSCCNIPFSNYEEDKCFTDNLEKIFKEQACDCFLSFDFYKMDRNVHIFYAVESYNHHTVLSIIHHNHSGLQL